MTDIQPDDYEPDSPELSLLYDDFKREHLTPLWTQIDDLMPKHPTPKALPHVWRWNTLYPLAERSGELVPVGRGGERRAIALANPGLPGTAYATPTLWAAIQYLGPHEVAPEHRHSQNAFRFVCEGEGVWTVVNGDPVAMSRGDFLLTPGWNFHGHHNETDRPMAWIDGLDIPFVYYTDTGFFEFGSERVTDEATPDISRSERLWAHPGLRPLSGMQSTTSSPIGAYRWVHTDAALREQLALEDEGRPATVEQGHAAIRYTNPTTGGDVLPTIRAEFHRLRPGATTRTRREVGSSVWQVFEGTGTITMADEVHQLAKGDLFVVPSWIPWSAHADEQFDLFRFSDAPIVERLHFDRVHVEGEGQMKLATVRIADGTAAVRVNGDEGTVIDGVPHVGALIARPDWRNLAEQAAGPQLPLADLATVIPRPGKIVCVGLNYRAHILEMGRPLPEYPTLFAKFTDALIGPRDDIEIPVDAADAVDWECELVVCVGGTVRGADEAEAAAAIAGYTVMNDVSMRDWQFRTREWLQGKNFGNTTPVGPVLVTTDEWQPGPTIRTVVDGEVVQEVSTGDLVFDPAHLVSYISRMITLRPGDIIATGTPGGVGHARKPPRYLAPGSTVRTEIDGIGALENTCVAVDEIEVGVPARHDQVTDPALAAALLTARRGTAYFTRKIAELPDAEFNLPSLLHGWTRAHVIAHVGYNARALTRLVEWAATGVETPMYAGPEQRALEIEEGATLKPEALRHLVAHSNVHLDVEWRDLPADAWNHTVRTAQGRSVPVSHTAWMRTREVWIHAVDLNNGGSFTDFPADVIDSLLLDITQTWRHQHGAGPDVVLHPSDRADPIIIGDTRGTRLTGTAADLTRWAAGRGARNIVASAGSVPIPLRWL